MSDSGSALEEARREYAKAKAVALSAQLQGISVAKFEVEALPDQREVLLTCSTERESSNIIPPYSSMRLQYVPLWCL